MKIENLFKGRIGRLHFLLIPICVVLPIAILFMVYGLIQLIGALMGIDTNAYSSVTEPSSGQVFMNFLNWALPAVAVILFIPIYFIAHFSVYVRRAHDIGSTTGMGVLLSVLTLIPYVGLIPGLYMLFKKGDEKENEYGVPNKSSLWKNILNKGYVESKNRKVTSVKEDLSDSLVHCGNCGKTVVGGANFCKHCGNKI